MNTLDYTCHNCGKPGQTKYDEACPVADLNYWASVLVCNRCADFLASLSNSRRLLADKCIQVSRLSANLQFAADPQAENIRRELEAIRQQLVRVTKFIAERVCGFYSKPLLWEPDFVDSLMDRPLRHDLIIRMYIDTVRGL